MKMVSFYQVRYITYKHQYENYNLDLLDKEKLIENIIYMQNYNLHFQNYLRLLFSTQIHLKIGKMKLIN